MRKYAVREQTEHGRILYQVYYEDRAFIKTHDGRIIYGPEGSLQVIVCTCLTQVSASNICTALNWKEKSDHHEFICPKCNCLAVERPIYSTSAEDTDGK